MKKNSIDNIITVDGGAGVGKSTVCKLVAEKLQYSYLNSGNLYRAITVYVYEHCSDIETNFSRDTVIRLAKEGYANKKIRALKNSPILKELHISALVPRIAEIPEVRDLILHLQQDFGYNLPAQENGIKIKGAIVEGRDIGSVVFPESLNKFYLEATNEVKAQRRFDQLKEKGKNPDYNEIFESLKKRDLQDKTRDVCKLIVPEGAIVIDTSDIGINEVVNTILNNLK